MSMHKYLVGCHLVLFTIFSGCNQADTNTISASGIVIYAGSPVAGAEVAFLPVDLSSETKPARGTTDSNGRFVVKTYFSSQVDAKGVRPGQYSVTVQKLAPPNGMTMDEWQIANMENANSTPPLRSLVPEKFSSAETSGLSATVEKDGENDFTFDLGS